MASFKYTARDHGGKAINGVMVAKDLNEVREVLRHKNQYLTTAREQAPPGKLLNLSSMSRRKVKLGDMVVMSRQLACLVRAGLSIIECLHTVAEQTDNALLVEALNQVRLDVLTGSTLTAAMRKHPKIFNEMYISLVQAGETGGVLDQTLETAASQFDKQAELTEKVKAAFVYPTLVLVASVGVVFFMLVFIVPVFAKVYDQFHAKLPAMTMLLVTMSYVILHYWWMVTIGTVATVWVTRRFVATQRGRRIYDRIMLKMPLMGKLIRKIAIARFTQTFAGTTRAGVPILSALTISAETAGNMIIMEAVAKAADFIKEGASLSVPLEQSGEFPSMVTRMISAGENSGNLDTMLDEITKFYHRDIEYSVERLTRVMEPLMTIVVGGIVLFILLALYMPVFNLTNVMKR